MKRLSSNLAALAASALLVAATFPVTADAGGRGSGSRTGASMRASHPASGSAVAKRNTQRSAKAGEGSKTRRSGPGDGTGNQGIGPRNGTGNGAVKGSGSGTCDRTGPNGTQNQNKGGKKGGRD